MPPRASTSSSKGSKDRAPALFSLSTLSDLLKAQIQLLSLPLSNTSIPSDSSSTVDDAPSSSSSSNPSVPATSTIISDLRSLFTLLSKETTALSLAFAPPKESWDAVLSVSKTLVDLTGKLSHALSLLHISANEADSSRESFLTKEWRMITGATLEALEALVSICHSTYIKLPATSAIKPQQRKQILTHTSLVWKTIERTENLAKTEVEAFRNSWKEVVGLLEDALAEVTEITSREVQEGPMGKGKEKEEVSDGEDDELDEFGEEDFDDDDEGPISREEAEVAQAALQVMKLVRALVKKVSVLAPHLRPSSLSTLHMTAQSLLAAHDDLASSLYPPQNLPEVLEAAKRYKEIALAILSEALARSSAKEDGATGTDEALANATQKLDVSARDNAQGNGTAKEAALQIGPEQEAWCRACQAQIEKTTQALMDKCQVPGR